MSKIRKNNWTITELHVFLGFFAFQPKKDWCVINVWTYFNRFEEHRLKLGVPSKSRAWSLQLSLAHPAFTLWHGKTSFPRLMVETNTNDQFTVVLNKWLTFDRKVDTISVFSTFRWQHCAHDTATEVTLSVIRPAQDLLWTQSKYITWDSQRTIQGL